MPCILMSEERGKKYRKKLGLGQIDPEDLPSEPPELPQMSGKDENHQFM